MHTPISFMQKMGLEPTRHTAQEPKSCMSANSITSANCSNIQPAKGSRQWIFLKNALAPGTIFTIIKPLPQPLQE